MLVQLNHFFNTLTNQKKEISEDDPRIAAVALLLCLVDADGGDKSLEQKTLKDIVSRQYELAGSDLKKLIDAGHSAYNNAMDIFPFTTILKHHFSVPQRVAFIGLLWEVAFSDGQVYELEDNLIWRIADMIGVGHEDRLALKSQIAQRLNLQLDAE